MHLLKRANTQAAASGTGILNYQTNGAYDMNRSGGIAPAVGREPGLAGPDKSPMPGTGKTTAIPRLNSGGKTTSLTSKSSLSTPSTSGGKKPTKFFSTIRPIKQSGVGVITSGKIAEMSVLKVANAAMGYRSDRSASTLPKPAPLASQAAKASTGLPSKPPPPTPIVSLGTSG